MTVDEAVRCERVQVESALGHTMRVSLRVRERGEEERVHRSPSALVVPLALVEREERRRTHPSLQCPSRRPASRRRP